MLPRGSIVSLAFLLALVAGCGCNTRPAPEQSAPPVNPADQKELTDLESQIAVKEKELADLRAKADAVRARVAGGQAKGGAAGLAELQKLIDAIPADHQPKVDADPVIPLNKANTWLKEKVNGKTIEISCKVNKVTLRPDPNKSEWYVCEVEVGVPTAYDFGGFQLALNVAGKVRTGGADWTTFVRISPGGQDGPVISATEADAKWIKALEGKTVRVSGTINIARFEMGLGVKKLPRFDFDLNHVTIDGYDTRRK